MFEWTGTFLSGSRLHRSFCNTRSETVAICHLRAAVHSKNQNSDIWTEVIQGLWSNNSGMNFPLGWKIHLWVLTHFENCLRHSCLINDCYICGSCINLRGEMFIIIIIIIVEYTDVRSTVLRNDPLNHYLGKPSTVELLEQVCDTNNKITIVAKVPTYVYICFHRKLFLE